MLKVRDAIDQEASKLCQYDSPSLFRKIEVERLPEFSLSSEIEDQEMVLSGYYSSRLDQNRHGGGLVIFL